MLSLTFHCSSPVGTESPCDSLTAPRVIGSEFLSNFVVISGVVIRCLFLLFNAVVKPLFIQNMILFTPLTWEVNCGGECAAHYSFANTRIDNHYVLLAALLEQLGANCHTQGHINHRFDTQPDILELYNGEFMCSFKR